MQGGRACEKQRQELQRCKNTGHVASKGAAPLNCWHCTVLAFHICEELCIIFAVTLLCSEASFQRVVRRLQSNQEGEMLCIIRKINLWLNQFVFWTSKLCGTAAVLTILYCAKLYLLLQKKLMCKPTHDKLSIKKTCLSYKTIKNKTTASLKAWKLLLKWQMAEEWDKNEMEDC